MIVVQGYILVAEARAAQAARLEQAIAHLGGQLREAQGRGAFTGPGPIFLGIGASHAASAAAVWTLRSRGIDAQRLNAGEHPLPFPASPHAIIGVSQSGKSAETLAALRSVDAGRRLAVVNVAPSPLADLAATAISLGNLPDSYASTIGYTATVAALGMIAEVWGGGATDPSWADLPAAFRQLEEVLRTRGPALAAPLAGAAAVDYAAAAATAGSAEVGALLLREVARVPATGLSTRQYLHGAMESAGKTAHVLMGDDREAALAQTLARAGHDTILLTSLPVAEEAHLAVLPVPALPPAQRAILEALAMQGLAVETAVLRGIDPDAFVFHPTDTKVA
jgi:fructoselysine-6-P-deglycase FrlB-like protein